MTELLFLGTGHGSVLNSYNACFLLRRETGYFMTDTGGGIGVIRAMNHFGIAVADVRHIFISHTHTDHVLGLIWMFRKIGGLAWAGTLRERICIYCSKPIADAILTIAEAVLQRTLFTQVVKAVDFVLLEDGMQLCVDHAQYTFFRTGGRRHELWGYETMTEAGRLVFLGDEKIDAQTYPRVRGCEYLIHEAFCREADAERFRPHEMGHTTVLEACAAAERLGVKKLILTHAEDVSLPLRAKLYQEEGSRVFSGKIMVPADLEAVPL